MPDLTPHQMEKQLEQLYKTFDNQVARLKELKTEIDAHVTSINTHYDYMKSNPWPWVIVERQAEIKKHQDQINFKTSTFHQLQKQAQANADKIANLEQQLESIYSSKRAKYSRRLKPGEIVLYSRENFAGNAQLVRQETANLKLPFAAKSVRVADGTGITLFTEDEFRGVSQRIATDVPNLGLSRLGAKPPASIRIWDETKQKFKGRWTLQTADGHFLSIDVNGFLTTSDGAGGVGEAELFAINTRGDEDAASVDVRLIHPQAFKPAQGDKPPEGQVVLASLRTLVRNKAAGRWHFSLMTGSGRWLAYNAQQNTFFTTKNEQEREVFRYGSRYVESETELGALEPGEIVLYDNPAYWGNAWVVHEDVSNLMSLPFGNDRAASVRLSKRTGITLCESGGFYGAVDDHIRDIADLGGTQLGRDRLSSLRVWRMVPPEKADVQFRYSLSEHDFNRGGSFQRKKAYCLTLRFPVGTEEVNIWATDATSMEINGRYYDLIDENTAFVRVKPNALNSITIAIPATALASPAVKIHTNLMRPEERIILYPDRDVHQRLANLKPNALWSGKITERRNQYGQVVSPAGSLVNRQKHDQRTVTAVQMTVQRAMESITYRVDRNNTKGVMSAQFDADLPVMVRQVKLLSAWRVSFAPDEGAANLGMAASGDVEIETANIVQDITDDEIDAITAQSIGRNIDFTQISFPPIIPPIDIPPIEIPPVTLPSDIVEWWNNLIKSINLIVTDVGNGLKVITQFVEDNVLKFVEVVLDSAAKVAAFAEGVLQKIEITWDKIVEFFDDLFDWDDILKEQDRLMRSFTDGITEAQRRIGQIKQPVRTFFNQEIETLKKLIRETQVEANPSSKERIRTLEMPEQAERLINILVGNMGSISVGGLPTPTISNPLTAYITGLTNQLESIIGKVIDVFGEGGHVVEDLLSNPDNPKRALDRLMNLLRTVMVKLLDAMQTLTVDGLDLLVSVLDFIKTLCTATIQIPAISSLYTFITNGKPLSLLSLTALLMAAPINAIKNPPKFGEFPFTADDLLEDGLTLPSVAAPLGLKPSSSGMAAARGQAPSGEAKYWTKVDAMVADSINFFFEMGLDGVPEDGLEPDLRAFEGVSLALSCFSWAGSFPGGIPFSMYQEAKKGEVANELEIAIFAIKTIFLGLDVIVFMGACNPGLAQKLSLSVPQRLTRGTHWTFALSSLQGLTLFVLSSIRASHRQDTQNDADYRVFTYETLADALENIPLIIAPIRMSSILTATGGISHKVMLVTNGLARGTVLGLKGVLVHEERLAMEKDT